MDWRALFVAATVGCFTFGTAAAAPPATVRWSVDAKADINAMHDLIRDNHPGPVDTENPQFNLWLEKGRTKALAQARLARSQADYWRALRLYANGFRDGHLLVHAVRELPLVWPGFLTSTDVSGATTVSVSTLDDVPVGASLASCDGMAAEDLLAAQVYPYRTNAAIPHERLYSSSYLLVRDADDRLLPRRCKIGSGGEVRDLALSWRALSSQELASRLPQAQGRVIPPLGVRLVGDVWFVSLPSFNWWGDDAARMQAMVDDLQKRAGDLHSAARVIVDVRGNGGGNSEWGDKIASILWGVEAVTAITASFDNTVDWRASAANARQSRDAADRARVAGLKEDAAYRYNVAAQMDAARAAGQRLWREAAAPTSSGLSASYRTPFAGKVYLLTDMRCASACLDFVDIVRRMPGVTHIGQPTSADAIYIDNVVAALPSGRADLSYSLKVYRHRIRGNNEWYKPAVAWPGGAMTDEAVARWVKLL